MEGLEGRIILPSIIGNNMILQQRKPIKIWGRAEVASKIKVEIFRKTDNCVMRTGLSTVDIKNNFEVELKPMEASLESYIIKITGEEVVVLEDVMVGEVWLTSGQSNMQLNLQYIVHGQEYMDKASNPNIRIFYQDHIPSEAGKPDAEFSYIPVFDVYNGFWKKADSAENTARCSGIGYAFGLELYEKLKNLGKETPIAIINSATGSSSIHAWISRETVENTIKVNEFLLLKNILKKRSDWNGEKELNFNQVSVLFNHKIAPLINLNMRGVLWYQGENDVGEESHQEYYKEAMKALIEQWGRDKIFILCQLAPFEYECSANALPGMRECLVDVHKNFLNTTAVIPIHDIDLLWDYGTFEYKHPIHPLTKFPVGKRMAQAAMALAYGEDRKQNLPPAYESMKIKNNRIFIRFKNVGLGLKIKEGNSEVKGFKISGSEGVIKEAKAIIIGEDIVELYNEEIAVPKAAEYGYAAMNSYINLFNSEDLPVLPFKTDRL